MNVRFIKSPEKKQILAELEKFYGIENLPYLLLETGKKKIRAFSGHLSKDEMLQLSSLVRIEIIGMYLISKKDEDSRISFDAVSLLRNQIIKNRIKLNKEQLERWVRGHDLEIKCQRGLVILEFEDDLVGIGKSNGEKIFNYVPKERKIKTPLPKINDKSM